MEYKPLKKLQRLQWVNLQNHQAITAIKKDYRFFKEMLILVRFILKNEYGAIDSVIATGEPVGLKYFWYAIFQTRSKSPRLLFDILIG